MKRNITIAAVTAAVLIGGGTYTAVAMGSDDGRVSPAPTATTGTATPRPDLSADDNPHVSPTPGGTKTDARRAESAALAIVPGTVTSVERDSRYWEVEILGKDGVEREVHVDLTTGRATLDRDHRDGATRTATPSKTDDNPHHGATPAPRPTADDDRRGGDDDGPGHDVDDDHGGDDHGSGRHGDDDGPGHDAGDDHGGGRHGDDD
ncbi:PepSY domain-containing protein [Streptomyces sp. NBC_00370]|uniref:PepSY domain-containing protein n=1 Tax=Streptomyces sp. NBC_00370 TaxID=2975728 RepID=UPI002E258FB6